MWVKILGLVCAGVFVGAAITEMKRHGRRDCKECPHGESGQCDAPECAEEVDGDDAAER